MFGSVMFLVADFSNRENRLAEDSKTRSLDTIMFWEVFNGKKQKEVSQKNIRKM